MFCRLSSCFPWPWAVLDPLAQERGWVDTALGTAIRTIIEIGLLSALLLWTAKAVRVRERLLRESEAGKSGAFEAALDCIVSITHEGTITEFNRAAERTFGYRREDVLGREFATLLIPPADRQRHRQGLAHYLKTGEGPILDRRVELTALRADGTEFPIELSVSRVPTASPPMFTAFVRDISARKRAEKQLRSIHETFFALVEHAPFGIYTVDSAFRIAQVNSGARPVFANVQPLIGRDFAEALRIIWPEAVASGIIAAFRRTLETGEPYFSPGLTEQRHDVDAVQSYEWELHRVELPDGQRGVVCYFFDSTKLQQAKQDLRQSERRYRRLFQTAKDGILILDADTGKVIDANPFMTAFWAREGLGKELWEIGLFRDIDESRAVPGTAAGNTSATRICPGKQSGQKVEVEFVSNVYAEDQQQVVQCNIRDITERSRLQTLTQEQADGWPTWTAARTSSWRCSATNSATRSPPSPTPCNSCVSQKNEDPHPAASPHHHRASGGTTDTSVDDLLEVSRITTGRIQLRQERIAVGGIVENAVETVRPLIDQRRHELTVSLPPQPIWLHADAARLEQVVVNLLTNAAKYTDEGGHIWLTVQQEGEEAVLRVRDTGVGIAPELLPRIFDLFTQAERSLDRSQGGLGIGLALVQRLVEMHGGTVAASSALGQGSEFVVRLPVVPPPAPQPSSPPTETAQPTGPSLRVLVVDDNVDTADDLGNAGARIRP